MVSIHHIFRLGPEVIIPAIVVVALPLVLMRWFSQGRSRRALWSLAVVNGLVFLWFGFIDGLLDHILKAVGLQNMTILPGGEAEVVDTFYSLGSPAATTLFYEGTGIVQAVASFAMLFFTVLLVVKFMKSTTARGQEVASSSVV